MRWGRVLMLPFTLPPEFCDWWQSIIFPLPSLYQWDSSHGSRWAQLPLQSWELERWSADRNGMSSSLRNSIGCSMKGECVCVWGARPGGHIYTLLLPGSVGLQWDSSIIVNLTNYIYLFTVCVCAHVCVHVCQVEQGREGVEDNVKELILSFYHTWVYHIELRLSGSVATALEPSHQPTLLLV